MREGLEEGEEGGYTHTSDRERGEQMMLCLRIAPYMEVVVKQIPVTAK